MVKNCILNVTLFVAIVLTTTAASAVKPEERIIGGRVADIAAHPYLASIRYRKKPDEPYYHACAGSIYSPTVIITAAQCMDEIGDEERLMVVVGGNLRTGVDGQAYPVKKWIHHPNYTTTLTVDYDIGLLMLETPLVLKGDVSSIGIRALRPAVGKLGNIAGWGYREEFGQSSYRLEEAFVPIVSRADCQKSYDEKALTERMICAGNINTGGVDGCHGDTGGPLLVDGELVGLISWGRGCARPGYPGVYTFVGSLKKWIDDTIAANN